MSLIRRCTDRVALAECSMRRVYQRLIIQLVGIYAHSPVTLTNTHSIKRKKKLLTNIHFCLKRQNKIMLCTRLICEYTAQTGWFVGGIDAAAVVRWTQTGDEWDIIL